MFAAHLVFVLSGSQISQILCVVSPTSWCNANAAMLDLLGVPACWAMLCEVLEACGGVELEFAGPALIKYAMVSFEHDAMVQLERHK